jgi:hypothetical protein
VLDGHAELHLRLAHPDSRPFERETIEQRVGDRSRDRLE